MVNEKDSAAQYERVPTTDARLPSSKEMGPQAEEPPSKVMVFGRYTFILSFSSFESGSQLTLLSSLCVPAGTRSPLAVCPSMSLQRW